MGRASELLAAVFRETFARESLPEAPSDSSKADAARGRGILSLLFAAEELTDLEPLPPSPGGGGFGALLAPEALPEDPPGPARPHGRWLTWLFVPERLD